MASNHYNFAYGRPYHPNGAGPSDYQHAGPSQWTLPATQHPFMPSVQQQPEREEVAPPLTGDPSFDILDWHPAYQSCQRFFVDHAQHEQATQALCALVNIRLPFQHPTNPIVSFVPSDAANSSGNSNGNGNNNYAFTFTHSGPDARRNGHASSNNPNHQPTFVSLIPYIRRLIVTGFDQPAILHGFFGDAYQRGILPHLDCERRNYLFAAKSEGFHCKKMYDTGSGMGNGMDESVPFMKPLEDAKVEELTAAEKAWSKWLAMEDWMVGDRRLPEEERREEREETMRGRYTGGGIGGSENLPDGVGHAFAGE